MNLYYRWPCGVYEDLGKPGEWFVMTTRPTPSTPSGDVVRRCASREEADRVCDDLNRRNVSWSEACAR